MSKKTDNALTINDQALARYNAVNVIMRAMRLGALTTSEANQAGSVIAMAELATNTPFFIRQNFRQIAGTLAQYKAKTGQKWVTAEHADTGLSYAWRASDKEPGEAEGVSNDESPDFPGEELETFLNRAIITV